MTGRSSKSALRHREGHVVPEPIRDAAVAARPAAHGRLVARLLIALTTLAILLPVPLRANGSAGQERAFLTLEVNTVNAAEAFAVVRGTEVWIEVDALRRGGLTTIGGEQEEVDGRTLVRLTSLAPQVAWTLDESALVVRLTVDPSLLATREIVLASSRPVGIQYRRDTSGFVNYALGWASGDQRTASIEGGLTLGRALFTTYLAADNFRGTLRGPTSITIDSRKDMRRWVLGDTFAATGTLGGALPLAGVAVSRDFDLDPYFVRYPMVGLAGTANTPAVLDIYVNGRLVRSEQVAPGSFTLANLPVPTGAASARVVIRDAFGREQEIGGAYYVTTALLARGLHQYQYAAGAERIDGAYENWRYGGPAVLANHRVGLTDDLTVGGRAEVIAGIVSGGPQMVARLGRFGEMELGAGVSTRDGSVGHAWSAAYLYVSPGFTIGGAVRQASARYATAAHRLQYTEPLALDAGLTVTSRVGSRASVSGTWQHQAFHGARESFDNASVTTRVRLHGSLEAFLTGSRTRMGDTVSPGVFAGLSQVVGRRGTVGAGIEHQDGRTTASVEAQRSLPLGEGYGYRVRANAGGQDVVDGNLQYQSRYARVDVRQTQFGSAAGSSVSVAGALVGIGGRLHVTRPVDQSFALVRVPGVERVRAYVSNQEIGRTNARGDLLVPNLLPYYGNSLRIADEDVPLTMTIRAKELTLAPPFRGGAVALFPVVREQRVTGFLRVIRKGVLTIPAYGRVVVQDGTSTIESPIGRDGAFYLEQLPMGPVAARVEFDGEACEVLLEVPASDAPVTPLGTLTCEAR